MKHKFRLFLKTFVICAISTLVFVGVGYYYLNKSFETVNNNAYNVPYEQTPCENKGILLSANNRELFVYLDFFENKVSVSLLPEKPLNGKIYGYTHDYTVEGADDLIIVIIDNVGGVELQIDKEKLRYTGIQVCELLKRSSSVELRRDIVTEVCKRINNYGVSSALMTEIINNSKNDLNLSECYFWDEYLGEICGNLHYID